MSFSRSKLRVSILMLIFLGISSSFIQLVFFTPQRQEQEFSVFKFPDSVPLHLWESKASQTLPPKHKNDSKVEKATHVIQAHRYTFSKPTKTLIIDTRYIVKTDGEVAKYLNQFYDWKTSDGQLTKSMHLEKGIGYYSLNVQAGNAILTSCINPNGPSTVLGRQFVTNRNTQDFKLNRLIPWFKNQISLKDERCLWVYMSLPLEETTNQEQTFKTLNDAWVNWYKWWKTRFPKEIKS